MDVGGSWEHYESQSKLEYPFRRLRFKELHRLQLWYFLLLGNGAASKSTEKTALVYFTLWNMNWVDEKRRFQVAKDIRFLAFRIGPNTTREAF